MDEFEKELKLGFLEEAAQAVADVEQCFLVLETNPEDRPVLDKIFRLAHNLKGSAKAVGFDEMGAFTHELESYLLKLKEGKIKVTSPTVNLLLRCNDHILLMINSLRVDLSASVDSADLIAEIHRMSDPNYVPESGSSLPSAEAFEEEVSVEVDARFAEKDVAQDVSHHEHVAQAVSIPPASVSDEPMAVEFFDDPSLSIPMNAPSKKVDPVPAQPTPSNVTPITAAKKAEPVATAPAKDVKKAPPMGQGAIDESIRVSLSRVEKLLNFVGEMVILQAVLREQAADSNSHLLKRTVHQLGKVTKEVQDMSMSLRMVPLKPTFQKMQRIVRDTAGALGKTVQLILVGEDTELDKTVLERINDPLVHLVRNSVDHGIENADVRRSRGKNPEGRVTLSAYHQSGKLVIEVKDDGGGLDPEKLKNIATQKGILKPGAVLTEKEAYNLIFAPGFSTKAEVTDISGRGVGMDVVRTNIQELNGEIQIESEIGTGTTFKIFLPLTLAIIDGMVIKLGDERFVIPLSHVHESVKPNIEDIKFTTGMGEVFMLRGENLPMYRLSHLLGRKSNLESHEMIAVVVRTGEIPFAILIDDIIGQYQVVIKQLGPEVQGIRGISGSTILGDGRPALILEPVDLVKRDRKSPAPRPTEARRAV